MRWPCCGGTPIGCESWAWRRLRGIGAWFAVEEKWNNGEREHEDEDSRLFAVDVTGRLINENNEYRDWEDALKRS